MAKVFITGAGGWLGTRLVETLANPSPEQPSFPSPFAMRCLLLPGQDASTLRSLAPAAEIVSGDIRNPADCARFLSDAEGAVLFHTAGIIHPHRVRELYDVNRDGTAHLLDAAIAAGVRRAVLVSSNSPCGCNPHPDHLFDELSPYHPYLHYGRSKMQMEQEARARSEKLEIVIVRAPWFYGPHQPARQTLFFKLIREGKVPIVGSGDNLRSMAYVDNLCQGLLLAALVPQAAGRIYWIADRRPYSMNEIVDTVERLLDTEFDRPCAHKRLRLPGFLSSMAYAADATLQSFGFYHQKVHVLSEMNKAIACSVARAQKELGYNPEIELEEGMRRSIRWCIDRGLF